MTRSIWISVPFLLAVTTAAQEGGAARAVDASAKKANPLASLKAADEAGRADALVAFIDSRIATGAIYKGQYDDLKKLEWSAIPTLRGWLAKAARRREGQPDSVPRSVRQRAA